MDRRLALLALPVLAGVVWYLYSNQGKTHSVSIDAREVAPSYSPFDHWMTQRPGGYVRTFPDRVGPACLGEIYQNEDAGALSTNADAVSAAEEYASA